MIKTPIYTKVIACLLILGGLFMASPALANLLVQWPASPMGTDLTEDSELHELVAYIYDWAIALGGLAVFIVLIISGVQYLTSTGKPEAMREATGRIRNAIIGLVLLLSIWLILNTINPNLLRIEKLELDLVDYISCDSNEYCETTFGENYKCGEAGYCMIDAESVAEAANPEACESITVKSTTYNGVEIDEALGPDDIYKISEGDYIAESTDITVEGKFKEDAKTCTGYIKLHEGQYGEYCADENPAGVTIVLVKGVKEVQEIRRSSTDNPVRCIEYVNTAVDI